MHHFTIFLEKTVLLQKHLIIGRDSLLSLLVVGCMNVRKQQTKQRTECLNTIKSLVNTTYSTYETLSVHYRLNNLWWQLRNDLQGLDPAVPREDQNLDPLAKYHVPADTPYIR